MTISTADAVKADIDLSVEHNNAEVDAIEGNEPNMHLLNTDNDYRRRYVLTMLAQYRQALIDLALAQDGYETLEQLSEPF